MCNQLLSKEIDVSGAVFNLKSKKTGKYSIQDSYRENYEDGLLKELEAPADVNKALNHIYYLNDQGQVISYKKYNKKIVSLRNTLISKNYPGKQLNDLPKEERLKIEKDISKQVLKSFSINEATRLLFSPELTNLINDFKKENRFFRVSYQAENNRIIVNEDNKEETDEQIKEETILELIEYSEQSRQMVELAINTNNLDDMELCLIDYDKLYHNLDPELQSHEEIKQKYQSLRERLIRSINIMKQAQAEYEKELDTKINKLLDKQDFKNLKSIINEIEADFSENKLRANDTKSNSIKEVAIYKLKNLGKAIALISLEDWDNKNFKIVEYLLTQNLPENFHNLLKKKLNHETARLRVAEEKFHKVDLADHKAVYNKFKELSGNSILVTKFFEFIVTENYEIINTIIKELKLEYTGLLLIIANNLRFEVFEAFWPHLEPEILKKILHGKFYQRARSPQVRDLFFQSFLEKRELSDIDTFFVSLERTFYHKMQTKVILAIIIRFFENALRLDELLAQIHPARLMNVSLEEEIAGTRLQELIVISMCKWVPLLQMDEPIFGEIMNHYPESMVYQLTKRQVAAMDMKTKMLLVESIKENKDALDHFYLKTGKKEYEKIIKVKLEKMVKDEPENFDVHFGLGISYFNEGEYEKALNEFSKCLNLQPQHHETHYNLALCYDRLDNFVKAMTSYKEAIKLKYDFLDAHYNLAILYSSRNNNPLAVQELKKVLKINPNHFYAYFSLGTIYDEMKELELAIEAYQAAIHLDPNHAGVYINLASDLSDKEAFEDAIYYFNEACRLSPENPRIHYNLGILYQRENNFPLAIAHYKAAIRCDKSYSDAYNNLGLIYYFQNKMPKAISMWEKAIALDQHIDAYNNMGWGYFVEGNLDKAIEVFCEGKKVEPNHPALRLNLGTVYVKKNNLSKAIEELEYYLKIEPDTDNAYEVMKIVKGLKKQI